MQTLISNHIVWLPVAFLASILFRSSYLNAHAAVVGMVAERLGWAAVISSALVLVSWVTYGQTSLNFTLMGHGVFGVRLDALSVLMLCLVSFLGVIILRFSRNYLAGDTQQGHYFKWMLFTLGAVTSLCLAPGLVQFWFSWVGCSLGLHHLLVYFPDRLGTLLSARKKFVVSRLGDLCLILAFTGIYLTFETQNFTELFSVLTAYPEKMADQSWVGWLIVAGAVLKSAQFPFHTWLPDTMGTPTPVSALMHAGIINAGGYLVIRMSPLLSLTPSALTLLAMVGVVTVVFGTLVMLTQTSVKRALAYSTIAQMGFMMLQCGLGAFSLAVLHLVAHSIYKGHAFLASGSSVAAIVRLEAAPVINPSRGRLYGVALLSSLMVVVFIWVFGLHQDGKPGMLVLFTVLVMAVAQFLYSRMHQGWWGKTFFGSVALAAGIVALYLGLAQVAGLYFAGLLPVAHAIGPKLVALLAGALALFFLMTLSLQDNRSGRLRQTLYVHALNGFYLNTIANRMARAAGLVPPGR